jgi:hypothetical protein
MFFKENVENDLFRLLIQSKLHNLASKILKKRVRIFFIIRTAAPTWQ